MTKKIISITMAIAMILGLIPTTYAEFAQVKVPTIENAAVIVSGNVNAYQTATIIGDVYVGGDFIFDNADNLVDGDIIYGGDFVLPQWAKKNPTGEARKAEQPIVVSDEYLKDESTLPKMPSDDGIMYKELGKTVVNNWDNKQKDEFGQVYYTINENTYFEGLSVNQAKIVIDATASDIYIKADQWSFSDGGTDKKAYIEVLGDNNVYIFAPLISGLRLNVQRDTNRNFTDGKNENVVYIVSAVNNEWENLGKYINADVFCNVDANKLSIAGQINGDIITDANSFYVNSESVINGDIYTTSNGEFQFDGKLVGNISTAASNVNMLSSGQYIKQRVCGNINAINAKSFIIQSTIIGNIITSAEKLIIRNGNSCVEGVVYAPYANVEIYSTKGNSINDGLLIAQSLDIHAGGSIECIENEVVSTVEPTIEPTDKPTTEPTDEPYADDLIPNNSVDRKPVRLKNASAYLFGRSDTLMQPNDGIQRAEACSVVYRLLKQNNKLAGYSIPSDSSFKDLKEEWYYSAIEFMNSIGVYNSKPNPDERKISPTNYITRGEAAKIFVFALGLQESEDKEEFVDLHEGDKYYEYINSLYQEGYLHGYEDGTIRVDEQITRAEYCKIYNLVIGRDDDYELVYLEDARVQCPKDNYLWYDVKAEDAVICPFADINEDDWYYEVMMRATCTFNDYKVDWNSRGDRNSLDDYDVE